MQQHRYSRYSVLACFLQPKSSQRSQTKTKKHKHRSNICKEIKGRRRSNKNSSETNSLPMQDMSWWA